MQQFFGNNHSDKTTALNHDLLRLSTELCRIIDGVLQSPNINLNEQERVDQTAGLNNGE